MKFFQPKNGGYRIRILAMPVAIYRHFRKVQEENNKWLQPDKEKTVEQIVAEKKQLQRDIHAAKVKKLLYATRYYARYE